MSTATQRRQEKDAAAIVEVLTAEGNATAFWISVQLNISKGTVINHLRRMLELGGRIETRIPPHHAPALSRG